MSDVKEKVAYLKGLIDGADFMAKDEKGHAIWEQMMTVFEEIGDSLEVMERNQSEMESYLEAVDEDLSDLEDEIYEDEDEDEGYVEIECPKCHETVYFDENLLDEDEVEITCPNCGAVVYDSTDEDITVEDGEECGCGHDHGHAHNHAVVEEKVQK
jgi:ribosomal protein S27E